MELADAYVSVLHPWQRDVLRCWLACDGDGKYAARTCGLIVARQNGKTQVIKPRIIWGLVFGNGGAGELIHYSAHRVDTTIEMFNDLVDIFGDPRDPPERWRFPELHALVKKIVFTNGRQSIELLNGSEIRFTARSTGAGRGFTCDVQIYDEAGFLTDDQLSALAPTKSAAEHRNPQTIMAGTPPSEHGIYAEPFGRARANAMAGVSGMAWHEWSVDEPGDIRDIERICSVNPSYGMNLLPESIEDELRDMSPEKFAIERLCWWPDTVSPKVLNEAKWEESASDGIAEGEDEKRALGVKFTEGHACACIAAKTPERVHCELVHDKDTFDGVQWLVDWICGRRDTLAAVYVDGRTGAGDLVERCARGGFPQRGLHVMTPSEMVSATSMVVGGINDSTVTHYPDDGLDASARAAVKRKIGNDGIGFGGDSCAIESMACAVYAVKTTRRNPARKMRVL